MKSDTLTPLLAVDILEDNYNHHSHASIPSTGPEPLRSASKSRLKLGHQRNGVFQHPLQLIIKGSSNDAPLAIQNLTHQSNVIIQCFPVFPLSPSRPTIRSFIRVWVTMPHPQSNCGLSRTSSVPLPPSPLFRHRPQAPYHSNLWNSIIHALGTQTGQ